MQKYGTAGVFFEKTAGGSPFAARVAAAVFSGAMIHGAGAEMDRQKMEAHQLNEQFRLVEQRMMAPVNQSLQHTQAPRFVPASSDLPVGWDEGMVRLASIASGAGQLLAKAGPTLASAGNAVASKLQSSLAPSAAKGPGMMEGLLGNHWKAKALGYGALAGGGYMALKGENKALGWMNRPGPEQKTWGSPETQLPMGVNSYGQPQLGTPLMG